MTIGCRRRRGARRHTTRACRPPTLQFPPRPDDRRRRGRGGTLATARGTTHSPLRASDEPNEWERPFVNRRRSALFADLVVVRTRHEVGGREAQDGHGEDPQDGAPRAPMQAPVALPPDLHSVRPPLPVCIVACPVPAPLRLGAHFASRSRQHWAFDSTELLCARPAKRRAEGGGRDAPPAATRSVETVSG